VIGNSVAHYLGVAFGFDSARTQTSGAERSMLRLYLKGKRCVVEVGVFEGFTTKLLAESSDREAVVYGVDPFFAGRLGVCWGLKITTLTNRKFIASGKVKLVRKLSTEVGNLVPEKVDYVFIDGDHSLYGIAADWNFWTSRLEPGGIAALHDTHLLPGQTEMGSHIFFRDSVQHDSRFEVVDRCDSLNVLRKRSICTSRKKKPS
jgi:predicted O-methyltransferase YrrM